MNINNLPSVCNIAEEHVKLVHQRLKVKNMDRNSNVEIHGINDGICFYDDVKCTKINEAILGILDSMILDLEIDMAALGVEFNRPLSPEAFNEQMEEDLKGVK